MAVTQGSGPLNLGSMQLVNQMPTPKVSPSPTPTLWQQALKWSDSITSAQGGNYQPLQKNLYDLASGPVATAAKMVTANNIAPMGAGAGNIWTQGASVLAKWLGTYRPPMPAGDAFTAGYSSLLGNAGTALSRLSGPAMLLSQGGDRSELDWARSKGLPPAPGYVPPVNVYGRNTATATNQATSANLYTNSRAIPGSMWLGRLFR